MVEVEKPDLEFEQSWLLVLNLVEPLLPLSFLYKTCAQGDIHESCNISEWYGLLSYNAHSTCVFYLESQTVLRFYG